MAKKKSEFDADVDSTDFTSTDEVSEPDSEASVTEAPTEPVKCVKCGSTGAVVVNTINGNPDKYGDCPDCYPCPEKCDNGKVPKLATDCPTCYGGRVVRVA